MKLSIIPADRVVVVDGDGRSCAFSAPDDVHAIHWDGSRGFIERKPGQGEREQFTDEAVIAPYLAAWEAAAPLPEPPSSPTISDRQFAHGLAKRGLITYDEAMAFVQTGTIPPALLSDIEALPIDEQADAKLILAGAVEYQRHHPLTEYFAARRGWSPTQTDEFWRFAATL